MPIVEFHYRVPWRTHSAQAGHHAGTQAGGGFEFHGHAPLMAGGDPRHLDVHASLRDPFGRYQVRTFRQRGTIPVYVVADLSASMGFRGLRAKMATLARLAGSVAYSAYRSGDPFGFVGCGETVEPPWLLPARRSKGTALELHRRLAAHQPRGRHWNGLAQAPQYLGRQRALVFLVSDFHLPLDMLDAHLRGFARHDVVPVVLWDAMEWADLPDWGLVRLADPESGASRTLFLRPALKARLAQRFAERRRELVAFFDRYGREPLFLDEGFDADALTRYFHGQ